MTETLYTKEGRRISLSVEIGRGGEGIIFSSPDSNRECIKFYPKAVPQETHNKLAVMVERPPLDPTYHTFNHRSIAWPSHLLYRDAARQSLGGFLMPRVDVKDFQKALIYIDWEERSKRFGGAFTWKNLFTAASNVSSAIAAVHDQGYCVGDINESNVLIALNALVVLIDCDSFQVPDPMSRKTYRCGVGKGEYTAPELLGKGYKDVDRTVASDSFALAVLLFQLLMEGTHPYQAKGKLVDGADNTEAKILRGHFAYAMRSRDIAPPDHAPSYELLPPEMRRLFQQCFVDGHHDSKARPNARDWYELFGKLKDRFVVCAENRNHCYLDHLRACPWCAWKKTAGRDHFLSPVGHQTALETDRGSADSLEKRIEHLKPYIQVAFADGILTAEEEAFLLQQGSDLQIPAKEIKKAIEAEARRVQGTKSVTVGTPRIEITRTSFSFEKVRKGTPLSGTYAISNVGGGTLQGKIRPRAQWVKVSQSAIDPTRHRQEHTFTAETTTLALGSNNSTSIDIESNGGNAQVQIAVSIEIEKEALARFRSNMFLLGTVVGGLFGYFLFQSLLPDVPSRAMVSFLAGITGLIGATIVASRSGGFFGGCGTFIVGSIVIGVLQTQWPVGFSVVAWSLTFAALLHSFARSLFVGKEAGKFGAATAALLTAGVICTALIYGGISLKDQIRVNPIAQPALPPLQMGTVSTCSKATGWRRFTAKTDFRANEPVCVYAEALNINSNGQIDLTFTVNLKNWSGATLTSATRRLRVRKSDPSAWYAWAGLKLPTNSPPGNYIAEVNVHNNLSNQNGILSASFRLVEISPEVPSGAEAPSVSGPGMTVSGTWTGTWFPTYESCAQPPYPAVPITLQLQQDGTEITGTLSGPKIMTGHFRGTLKGPDLTAAMDYGGSLKGSVSETQIRGDIVDEPKPNLCNWSGNFEVTR